MDPEVFNFDGFRVDLRLLKLTRSGQSLPLEPKAFDVLRYLIEHRDRVVTKDELLDSVWADTFVTPNVLTRAIAQLRRALGDDASKACIVETVAKRGYRFIAVLDEEREARIDQPRAVLPVKPGNWHWSWISVTVLALLAAAAAASAVYLRSDDAGLHDRSIAPAFAKFNTRAGYNGMATLSPDGHFLAYVSDISGALEIYVASLAFGSEPRALTKDGKNNLEPAWSPDGQFIAFRSGGRRGIWIVPAAGGTPRQVTEFGSQPAWSPDGKQIAFTSNAGGGFSQSTIWTIGLDGAPPRQITTVEQTASGQDMPSWSPDGRFIAFSISQARKEPSLGIVSIADGNVLRVRLPTTPSYPKYSPDGRYLYWIALWQPEVALLRIRIGSEGPVGDPEQLRVLDSGQADGLSIAHTGAMAVSVTRDEWNLWSVETPAIGQDAAGLEPVKLTNEIARSGWPDYSRDGRIAFLRMLPGREVSAWMMNEDGSHPQPLLQPPASSPQWTRDARTITLIHGTDSRFWRVDPQTGKGTPLSITRSGMQFPRVSPDGRTVAFHVIQPDGSLNVWTQSLDGGPAKQLTFDKKDISFPVWSPDGQWLAVQAVRGDSSIVGIIPSTGGPFEQVVFDAGQSFVHSWSPDGKEIAFAGERDGVWNIYAVSRETKKIRQFTHFVASAGYVRYPSWSPRGGRIAFERNIRTGEVWTSVPQ